MNEHRSQLTQITSLASSDATVYARSIADESPERFAAQMRDAGASIIDVYAGVAAEGAALFYEAQRPKPAPATVVGASVAAAVAADLGWAFLPLFKPEQFPDPLGSLLSNIGGVVQKHVAAGDRNTIVASAANDPLSGGVRRFARANACAFCRYLVAVDADVEESTSWHRNCHCVSVPWWEDNPLPTDPNIAEWASAAENARAELLRLQYELKPSGMRWRNFFKARPDLAINNRNIARLMRAELGISH